MRKASILPTILILAFGPARLAGADPQSATHVDSLSANVFASSVSVSGQATFVDVQAQVGEDGSGDALVSGVGADATTLKIARPDPAKNTLRFTLGIADQPPNLNGIPEFVAYDWEFTVVTGSETAPAYRLHAQRTAQATAPGVNPVFRLYRCVLNPQSGINECSNIAALTGKMQDGVVEMDVPMNRIAATPGQTITTAGDGVTVVPSLSGVFWGVLLLDTASQDVDYVIPGSSVKLGIAPSGTQPESVALTGTATVNASGGFSGSLPTSGLAPGSYTVVAKACFGPASCGLGTTTVTIP